jgi:hypothetical protein
VIDPGHYYDLEAYLLDEVRPRFAAAGYLSAFDFFSIIIWKANRAKSHVARRLLRADPEGRTSLEPIVRDLTRALHQAPDDEARMRVLVEDWGFALPMASAVLTILWPDRFTVYDVRVCGQLGRFRELAGKSNFARVWPGYCDYVRAVDRAVPGSRSLREKDRVLWARSAIVQLEADIANGFGGTVAE